MKRFLIIQTAFLGDVILATPVLSELKRIYPDSSIDIVVRKGNEALLQNNFNVDTIFVWNKKEGKYKSLIKLIRKIRRQRYSEVINLHRYTSSGIITFLTKAERKVGFDKNPLSFLYTLKFKHEIGQGKHEVERNLALVHDHGVKSKIRPSLYPSKADFEKIERYIKDPFICFSPASVWYTKQLPKEKWIELGNKMNTIPIYLLGGLADKALCDSIQKEVPNSTVLAGKLSLLESAALISKAAHSYVNDSGPMHISSAMNTATTAFFCSTIPEFGFGPLAENSKIISLQMNCKPCGLHGFKSCPKTHFNCGNKIDVQNSETTI